VKKLDIDPITRLEGHEQILLYLDDGGGLTGAVLQIPKLRGFETFCRGRRGEEMPQITKRICGVCLEARHLASAQALDAAYAATVPAAAWVQRELFYNAYIFADHLLHLVFLGGPDLLLPADTPKANRNVLGILQAFPERMECCGTYLTVGRTDIVGGRAARILRSARGNGADVVVTTCPLCQFNLDDRRPPEAPAVPVLYLGQLLAWAMGADEPAVAALLTGEPATGELVSKGV